MIVMMMMVSWILPTLFGDDGNDDDGIWDIVLIYLVMIVMMMMVSGILSPYIW